jgi:hypothetical protein
MGPPQPDRPLRPLHLHTRTRAAAWIVTGPLGHLWAGAVDWAVVAARIAWARARGREVRWEE